MQGQKKKINECMVFFGGSLQFLNHRDEVDDTMKFAKESEKSELKKRKSAIKSHIIRNKTEKLRVSKFVVKEKQKFEEAKTLLMKINGGEFDTELSFSEEPLRELSLADIMRAINELSYEPYVATKDIADCSFQMASDPDIFWTSPRAILRAIKYSILRRKWDNITHFLLLLLHHKDQYISLVRKLCLFISKFNPMVQELGLQEEFETLKEKGK